MKDAKASARDKLAAKRKVDAMKAAFKEAEEKWSTLADSDESIEGIKLLNANGIITLQARKEELKKEDLIAAIEYAAKSYFQGDSTAWNQLTPKERNDYNSNIIALNEHRDAYYKAKIQEAKKRLLQAHP